MSGMNLNFPLDGDFICGNADDPVCCPSRCPCRNDPDERSQPEDLATAVVQVAADL
jgi:hypothetical protein